MNLDASVQQTLTQLEDQGWAELAAGHGVEFYRELFADEGRMVFASGVFSKTESLEGLAAARPWAKYELRNINVIPLTAESAAVLYEVEAQRTGEPPYRAYMTSTYVRRDGHWKLVLHTQTPRPV